MGKRENHSTGICIGWRVVIKGISALTKGQIKAIVTYFGPTYTLCVVISHKHIGQIPWDPSYSDARDQYKPL